MRIQYRIKEEQAEIVRCFGTDSRVSLPEQISGYPVRKVAAYAFSARKSKEDTDVLVYETEDSLFESEKHLLAGQMIESVVFPDTVEQIGNYIFYGCKSLRELEFSDALKQIGSGAFTGCGQIAQLKVHMKNGDKSCVKEILGELWQRIDVTFYYGRNTGGERWEPEERLNRRETDSVRSGNDGRSGDDGKINHVGEMVKLVFPEHYEEAVENTPARILFTQHHGTGNNYRQCFYDRELDYRKYDELFPLAAAQDKPDVLADLVFDRLEYPKALTETHEKMYENYVCGHLPEITEYLIKKENLERLDQISMRGLWSAEGIDQAIRAASESGKTEMLSFLMNEKHHLFPERKRKQFEL